MGWILEARLNKDPHSILKRGMWSLMVIADIANSEDVPTHGHFPDKLYPMGPVLGVH